VEPQRRKNDENEIDHWRYEAERRDLPHAVDMQRQRDRRHRRFDQRADIPPDHGDVAIKPEMPADDRMDPKFKQDERGDNRIKIGRPKIAVPDAAHRLGMTLVYGLNRACDGSASPRSSWPAASEPTGPSHRIANSTEPRPSA